MATRIPRIGIDVKTFALHRGGITAALRTLLPALVERVPGVEWVAFGPSESLRGLPERLCGVPIELIRGLGGIRLPVYDQWQVRRAAAREALSLFYSPYFDAPVGLGIPTVVTMHDAVHLRFPALYPWSLRIYYGSLMRAHAVRAAAIITDSEFSRRELIALAGADASRLHVVGIPLGESFLRRSQRERVGPARQAERYVLYSGGVEARKNLSNLFRAWALWRRTRFDAPVLALTGEASRYRPFDNEIERLGLRDRLRFTGLLTDEQMVDAYAGALFVVYPSLYEGFGLPIVEAQAAGAPVACSNRASLPETGGDAALYFDPESPDAMVTAFETLLSDRSLAASLVERGRERACRFSAASAADRLAGVLRATLEQR
jgi:glycosyltransferase involved in cell wall biosynthesis